MFTSVVGDAAPGAELFGGLMRNRSFGRDSRQQRVEPRGRLLHAMREIAVALVRLRKLVAPRFVGRPQRPRVRKQRRETVFERGEFVVHGARSIAPTIGAAR